MATTLLFVNRAALVNQKTDDVDDTSLSKFDLRNTNHIELLLDVFLFFVRSYLPRLYRSGCWSDVAPLMRLV
ncbi:MAG: hypothetical protein A2107_08010 [Verrucomicrobia bacterium GWF2_62_7]|nr:MAG: hypothetical protein A2107_08010 [Verrucomicrobia bacterium GWF2_62_7]